MNGIDSPAPREWWGPLPEYICGICGVEHDEAEHEDDD